MRSHEVLIEASGHLHYEVWMLRLASFRLEQFVKTSSGNAAFGEHAFTHTTHIEVSVYSSNAPIVPPSDAESQAARVNSDIESFTVHLRALLDFFYIAADKARADDIIAEHFFQDPEDWYRVRPQLSDSKLTSIRDRVGKEIAHLTYKRLFLTTPQKLWPFLELKTVVLDALQAFLGNVDPSLLSERWKAQSA
jgi:hypothetical protein